jgi:catechol 2,3-dioxygenase-like lactoylglutathione lyase family enzyme
VRIIATIPIVAIAAAVSLLPPHLAAQTTPSGSIVGVGNFSHIVASLERSVEFYRDVVGLELPGPPRLFSGDTAMKVGNTPGAQSLFTTLPVPGSPLGVEIIEYRNIERQPAARRFQDPGAAKLVLTVRDIDAVVVRARKMGARINTTGGLPVSFPDGSRVIVLQDPDGFFVELIQPSAAPETTSPGSSNVIGSGFELAVEDIDRTVRLYREALGFELQTGSTFTGAKFLMEATGTTGAQVKRSAVRIPGSPVTLAFLEFKELDRKALRSRFQDPGTPILQLRVRDIQAVTNAWKRAGGEVVTADGEPVNLGNLTLVVLRDPNNLMLELIAAP